jgi:uncharacterized protein
VVRVVIDTNVMVSALIGPGKPRRLVARLLRHHSVVTSAEMIEELVEVLPRKKFGLTSAQIDRFLTIYADNSQAVASDLRVRAVVQDPDDDFVLSTAVKGSAGYLVTGDRHLLALKAFRGYG